MYGEADQEMILLNRTAWLCATACSILLMASCGRDSNVEELDGLRATVTSVSWLDSDHAVINYRLEWTEPDAAWVLKGGESAMVRFWDVSGDVLGPEIGQAAFFAPGEAFRLQQVVQADVELHVDVPENTDHLSVELGQSGLRTDVADVSVGRP